MLPASKRKIIRMNKIISPIVIFLVLTFAGCDVGGLRGNGHLKTESLEVTLFVNVEASGAFTVEWQNGPPSASVTTDENLLPFVDAKVTDGTFRVRTTRSINPNGSIKLALTSPSREGASLRGASRFTAQQLTGAAFALKTAGASKVTLDGNINELVASMTGASELRAESLQTKTAELDIAGAGDARVNVSETLKASITGAGKVEYSGNPAHVEKHVAGAGTIRKRE
jgi:Putative auto-transporter adhesin, head GIN domain